MAGSVLLSCKYSSPLTRFLYFYFSGWCSSWRRWWCFDDKHRSANNLRLYSTRCYRRSFTDKLFIGYNSTSFRDSWLYRQAKYRGCQQWWYQVERDKGCDGLHCRCRCLCLDVNVILDSAIVSDPSQPQLSTISIIHPDVPACPTYFVCLSPPYPL